jgi:hypothetical protein
MRYFPKIQIVLPESASNSPSQDVFVCIHKYEQLIACFSPCAQLVCEIPKEEFIWGPRINLVVVDVDHVLVNDRFQSHIPTAPTQTISYHHPDLMSRINSQCPRTPSAKAGGIIVL